MVDDQKLSRQYAQQMDENDPLKSYRGEFFIPKQKNGKNTIYLCGNSLGLQPKNVRELVINELDMWEKFAVEGHFKGTIWKDYHEKVSELFSNIVGAKQHEVIAMNSLTVNLHLMLISFYRPSSQRYKILVEETLFPSDHYAIKSQLKLHGYDRDDAIIFAKARPGKYVINPDDILRLIEKNGNEIALILLGGVNYLTGQVFNMETITKKGHEKGCLVGFDLAHAFANIKLELHDWGVDFAVWCTYKYGNGGPGSVAGCFVHEKHGHNPEIVEQRLTGWWGHDKENRFLMKPEFIPIKGAEGWQISNPSILSMAPLLVSLPMFVDIGMDFLVKKSKVLTSYMYTLIKSLNAADIFLTPEDESMRGCQISIHTKTKGKKIFSELTTKGVICDWREPDVIRVAPTPLYNSFTDVFDFYSILKDILHNK